MTDLAASALLFLFGAPGARAAKPPAPLVGVDVIGTERLTPQSLQERFGADLQEWLRQKGAKGKTALKRVEAAEKRVVDGLRAMGGFSFVALEWTQPLAQGAEGYVLTVELVEESEAARRMPFAPAPTGRVAETSGLLDAWTAYQDIGREMVRRGEFGLERPDCPAFYCTFGSRTPDLAAHERRFVEQVPLNMDLLVRVLREDRDAARRTSALYLLSYLKDGGEVARLVSAGLADPDIGVREAALQVFNDMAVHHRDLPIPLDRVAVLLESPYADDRSRALGILVSLADHPPSRPFLLHRAAPMVLKLLRLQHPSNHSVSHVFLGLLSGMSYPDREYEQWEKWLARARATEPTEYTPEK